MRRSNRMAKTCPDAIRNVPKMVLIPPMMVEIRKVVLRNAEYGAPSLTTIRARVSENIEPMVNAKNQPRMMTTHPKKMIRPEVKRKAS